MYSDIFCKVYNEFGWNYYPEIFGEQLLQWLKEKALHPANAMDLACGTGVLCEIMSGSGIRAAGMDLSEGMIAIARQRDPSIPYFVDNMVTFCPEEHYDLVTCTGDAVNHLPRLEDVEGMFRSVYTYLNNGGWFVFDLLRESEVSDSEPFEMDFDQETRVWFQMTRPTEATVNLCIRVYKNGEPEFEENIRETLRDPGEICAMLERCGFRQVQCRDRLLESSRSGTTWFITAQKQS